MKTSTLLKRLDINPDEPALLLTAETHHPKRGALLKNFEMLKHYGLTDNDCDSLDFY